MGMAETQSGSLSQRELRNEPGRVLREVSEGHSFVLTNRGIAVGRIVPLDAPPPRCLYPDRPSASVVGPR